MRDSLLEIIRYSLRYDILTNNLRLKKEVSVFEYKFASNNNKKKKEATDKGLNGTFDNAQNKMKRLSSS